jgi:hypothetical protein
VNAGAAVRHRSRCARCEAEPQRHVRDETIAIKAINAFRPCISFVRRGFACRLFTIGDMFSSDNDEVLPGAHLGLGARARTAPVHRNHGHAHVLPQPQNLAQWPGAGGLAHHATIC